MMPCNCFNKQLLFNLSTCVSNTNHYTHSICTFLPLTLKLKFKIPKIQNKYIDDKLQLKLNTIQKIAHKSIVYFPNYSNCVAKNPYVLYTEIALAISISIASSP